MEGRSSSTKEGLELAVPWKKMLINCIFQELHYLAEIGHHNQAWIKTGATGEKEVDVHGEGLSKCGSKQCV